MLPATFSIIALQEVWSIYKTFELTGYSNIIFKTRDMNKERNPNCGGGVGFFVNSKLEFEVLEEESIFIEGVYESLWIKVEVTKNIHKIIKLLECPIPLSVLLLSVTKNPDHFCSCCISQTWSNGFLQSFKQYVSPPDFNIF